MKPYLVTYTVTAVVVADDSADARKVAEKEATEVVADLMHSHAMQTSCVELASLAQAEQAGWHRDVAPYGKGNKRSLAAILENAELVQ